MHLTACVALSALSVATLTSAAPFDTGFGGVYSDSNAQNYFSDRFGGGFFANLRAKLAGVVSGRSSSSSNRRQQQQVASKPAYVPEQTQQRVQQPATTSTPVYVQQQQQQQQQQVARQQQQQQTQKALYRDAVAPPTSMDAADVVVDDTNSNANANVALKGDDLSYYYYDDANNVAQEPRNGLSYEYYYYDQDYDNDNQV